MEQTPHDASSQTCWAYW